MNEVLWFSICTFFVFVAVVGFMYVASYFIGKIIGERKGLKK